MSFLSDIEFIVATRIDNQERAVNAVLTYSFFKNNSVNSKFTFVEDSEKSSLPDYVTLQPEDKYIFEQTDGNFRKCRSYNIGFKKSERPYVCFLDLDVVVDPKQIIKVISSMGDCDFGLPYNGICCYLDYNAKKEFIFNQSVDTLKKIVYNDTNVRYFKGIYLDGIQKRRWGGIQKFDKFTVLSNNSIGGCLIAKREAVDEIKGFNENFIGWGYEDSEIISRIRILGKQILRANRYEDIMYHFPHTKSTATTQSPNNANDYNNNHIEIQSIENKSKEELKEHLESWTW